MFFKNNKKGFLLLEAMFSISLLFIIIGGLAYVSEYMTEFDNKVDQILVHGQYSQILNKIEFIKQRTLAMANEHVIFAEQGLQYPGWTEYKVTSNSTQSLNDLNGNYILSSDNCPPSLLTCFKALSGDDLGEIFINSEYTKNQSSVTDQLDFGVKIENGIDDRVGNCSIDESDDCMLYKLTITDLENSKSANLDYTDGNGVNRDLKMKAINITIISGGSKNNYSYTLSVF